ncbi:EsaB/YukD family protein [Virgibacillus sp. SK37]|uniref:EsaB/YukD family protein n=1 Tax=Virgibacillus sp. SK37 TaxID=403957 RepID=UPI0004D173C4|nr:EsaB/YukD family protein [Virgibacillus sp. SK37]AIF42590.1 ubiquitin [Virgibacillus sp. SK37]
MYINVTIDLNQYNQPPVELRLSDQHRVKNLVDITWQAAKLHTIPREGYWIRVTNKKRVFDGSLTLKDCGITAGDRIEIL